MPLQIANSLSYRITVDDLGLYPGVEKGVLALSCYGIPLYCSWLTNYFPPSTEYKKQSVLKSGLHFNIIEGNSKIKSNLLCDAEGRFSRNWGEFIFASRLMKIAIEDEFEQQISQAIEWFGTIHHVDSHLHIHSIPWLYAMLERKQKKYHFEHLRNPYQPILDDATIWFRPKIFAKIMILRSFALANSATARPCFGISDLFTMNHEKVFNIFQKSSRELVCHAAKEEKNIEFRSYNYLTEKEVLLRDNEWNELDKLIQQLSSGKNF